MWRSDNGPADGRRRGPGGPGWSRWPLWPRRPRSRAAGCLLWIVLLVVLLIVLSVMFGGFQKGTRMKGVGPALPVVTHGQLARPAER